MTSGYTTSVVGMRALFAGVEGGAVFCNVSNSTTAAVWSLVHDNTVGLELHFFCREAKAHHSPTLIRGQTGMPLRLYIAKHGHSR